MTQNFIFYRIITTLLRSPTLLFRLISTHNTYTNVLTAGTASRPGQIYLVKCLKLHRETWAKTNFHPIPIKLKKLQTSEGFHVGLELALSSDIWSLREVVKRCWISI